ncbi:MAG: DUF4826 family protein [Planctomycetota bacterium]
MDSDDTPTIEDAEDKAWVAAQRQKVVDYLSSQRVEHGGVSLEPRWFLSPYVAVWAVRSPTCPERVGWWAISGDLPTDYMSFEHEHKDSGDVLIAFSKQWQALAEQMALGRRNANYTIGDPAHAKELAPLLATRAGLLHDFGMQIKKGEL